MPSAISERCDFRIVRLFCKVTFIASAKRHRLGQPARQAGGGDAGFRLTPDHADGRIRTAGSEQPGNKFGDRAVFVVHIKNHAPDYGEKPSAGPQSLL